MGEQLIRLLSIYTLTEPFGGTSVSDTALGGTTAFDDLAVDLATPLAESDYTLDVERPGYDVAGAAVEVGDNTAGPDPSPVPSIGSTGITVGVAAGSDRSVDVNLAQYGTLAGSVQGETWPGEISDLNFPAVTLDAHRCDSAGNDLGTAGVVVTIGTAGRARCQRLRRIRPTRAVLHRRIALRLRDRLRFRRRHR